MDFIEFNNRLTFIAWFMLPAIILNHYYLNDVLTTYEYIVIFVLYICYWGISVNFLYATTIRHLFNLGYL